MDFAESQSVFARALLDAGQGVPVGIVCARGGSDAVRLAVYRNNIVVGLTNALAKRFPVTERLVGKDFFAGMARAYVGREKPQTPLLFAYGDGFPDFIAGFEPAGTLPYLADIARLEAAWTRAYHAEEVRPLTLNDLGALEAAILPEARFAPHPSATLVSSRYAIGAIWEAHRCMTVRPVNVSQPETVLVARPEADVFAHVLPARDAGFAAALLGGETLAAAAERALGNPSFDPGAALVGLVSLGAFSAVTTEAAAAEEESLT